MARKTEITEHIDCDLCGQRRLDPDAGTTIYVVLRPDQYVTRADICWRCSDKKLVSIVNDLGKLHAAASEKPAP